MATVRDLNRAMLIGHLTRDPEVKYTPNGALVCTFGVATNRQYKKSDGTVAEEAEYHNIVCWGKLGEICSQLLKTGSYVWIEGEFRNRSWEDASGVKHFRPEIRADDMKLLDKRSSDGNGKDLSYDNQKVSEEDVDRVLETPEDLPF